MDDMTNMGDPIVLLLGAVLFFYGMGTGAFGLGVGILAAPLVQIALAKWNPGTAPLSLALNGLTCLVAALVLVRRSHIVWKHALGLGLVASVCAMFAAAVDRTVPPYVTWYVYLGILLFLVAHLLRPPRGHALPRVNWAVLYLGAIPAGLAGGFVGVGPAFALMPGLIVAGMERREAIATAAAASVLPSFCAFAFASRGFQFSQMPFEMTVLVCVLFLSALIGTLLGALYTATKTPTLKMQRWFAGAVAALGLIQYVILQ